MNTDLYKIELITNMHVGSGDISYDIIDNKVQRDPVNGYPTINPSSLKGALREHFVKEKSDDNLINSIFGHGDDGSIGTGQAKYRFFNANLLFYPVRTDVEPYILGTSIDILKEFVQHLKDFSLNCDNEIIVEYNKGINSLNNKLTGKKAILVNGKKFQSIEWAEDILVDKVDNIEPLKIIEDIIGKDKSVIVFENMKEILEELPIIARNKLNNGLSENLWYEEIVPKKTIFYFYVLKDEVDKNHNERFEELLNSNLIQIGGNATIGYGYTSITNIKKLGDNNG
jgi:CRISPR-associated protein Cmr4